jgi:CRISPR type III-A-associated RAMP protein Csm5
MQSKQTKQYRVNLHILSPVHIGTGQELDPFAFIIRGETLFLIDLVKWMENYPEKNQLYRMMDSDNYANIRSFIAEQMDLRDSVLCTIPVDSSKLLKTYSTVIREKNPRNQVLISPNARNDVTKSAYIPGSSIKGSIRTAVANHFVKKAGVTVRDSKGRNDYSRKIFGQISNDPMRWMKLSDVSLGKSGTVILEAKKYPLNPNKPLTPKGHVEAAQSLCHTGKEFVYPLRFSMAPFELHGTKVDPGFVVDALYRFYMPKYEEEYVKFYNSEWSKGIQQGILPMSKLVVGLKTNETLIRIGHYSHVECVTLDGVRKPRTRNGRDGKPLPWGKTRTLANGIYPFGWAKLEFLDLEAEPRPERDWPFVLNFSASEAPKFTPEDPVLEPDSANRRDSPLSGAGEDEKPDKSPEVKISPLEKLLNHLKLIKSNDMGRIGTVIQKIDALETDQEKGEIAKAIKNKIGPKAFKKHKRRDYLLQLMNNAKTVDN